VIRTSLVLVAALAAAPLHAQSVATPANSGLAPAAGNANLSVASVRMTDGVRASKIIGAAVNGSDNTQLATIDDLMMKGDHTVTFAILSVGGVMGMGSKLVAVPIAQLQPAADGKFTLPGATKESLNAMPTFVF
jgi:hypothetical protein